MDTGWATTGQLTPVTGRAKWTVILLAATIAVDVIAIAFDVWEISLLERVLDGRAVGQDELSASDTRQGLVAFLELAVLIATVVLFIRWFSAAYRNLLSLGVSKLRHSPGWAIGAWFVPLLNLWRPKEIANDIWRGSDPDAPAEQGSDFLVRRVPGVLNLWWAAWIIASFVQNFAVRLWFDADTTSGLRSSDRADIAGLVLDIVAAVLAIVIVRRLTARQTERAGRFRHDPVAVVSHPL